MSILEQTSSITIQNIKVSFSEAGKGESVLCLHGNPGTKRIFSDIMTKIDGLNIRLVAPDRPGHNSSDELPPDKEELWGDTQIYSELIDKKLNHKAWILGYDYGCITAIKIAIKYPEKVKGLIFLNPLIELNNPKESISNIPNQAKGAFMGTILGIFLPNKYYDIFGNMFNKMFAPEIVPEDFSELWLQRYTKFENIVAYLNDKNIQIKILNELKEEMKKFSFPTFALIGGKDSYTDVEKQKEAISLIPNSKIEISNEAGHYMPHLNPEICAEFIKKNIIAVK